tara:strand:+ start:736 stop:936 length:201 start_codon:yes stop_codon:yes gene_type:complete
VLMVEQLVRLAVTVVRVLHRQFLDRLLLMQAVAQVVLGIADMEELVGLVAVVMVVALPEEHRLPEQ